MRRGHSGGGWRSENPRHFWPRGGGVPRHGPPQQYPLLELHAKYGGPRMTRGGHYNPHVGPNHRMRGLDHHSFGPHNNRPRFPGPNRDLDRYNYPPLVRSDTSDSPNYKKILSYCENRKTGQSHINSHGDVDHRQNFALPPKPYDPHPISPWASQPIENRRASYDDRGHRRPSQYRDNVDGNIVPTFTGHRPPSSDHYGTNVDSAIDNSNSFSRSVDDTVDIVRRRLLNRNECHNSTDPAVDENLNKRADTEAATATSYQSEAQAPPTRKRIQRRRQNAQSNCDKIKNKIVHQLFKMDKEKIHKLMDNPNSSSKFEYAISSLITESQNSLDRHLRSVAEKSLCSSSTEFIQNDNNTIYEDTFLKQMQCILEPQDTVLLEDIKPLVMAELNKVLQLDEFDQRFERGDDELNYSPPGESSLNTDYPDTYYNVYNDIDFAKDNIAELYTEPDNNSYYEDRQFSLSNFPTQCTPESPRGHEPREKYNNDDTAELFERRAARRSRDYNQTNKQNARECESREQHRRSIDEERSRYNEARRRLVTPPPVFDANAEQLSEEDDPFADLDKQYHVAVDRNFIEEELDKQYMEATEKNITQQENKTTTQVLGAIKDLSPSKPIKKEVVVSPEISPAKVKIELHTQLLNIAKSPLKLPSGHRSKRRHSTHSKGDKKKDDSDVSIQDSSLGRENEYHEAKSENIKLESNPEVTDSQESSKSENSNIVKSTIRANSRKRSIDQKPSHRKEKRKKSDVSPEQNKQILNKNIIINVNDCGSKSAEKKCDAGKSIFNLFFAKDEGEKELPKENKNIESSDKAYSDKYVKRKEKPKKKESESKRKRSTSNSHSNVSPKDKDINNSCSEASKPDAKNKLKTIDMFVDHPAKANSVHQSHRNTATPATKKTADVITSQAAKSTRQHEGTQVILKSRNKETQTTLSKNSVSRMCQTEVNKLLTKANQTDPVSFANSKIKSTDTFERMKEIDLEIQVLLQEKFKLYNSLEAKVSSSNSNLGMTVLNVTPIEEGKDEETTDVLSEDDIVDNFTSIPVEELEEIALESVQDVPIVSPKKTKRSKRQLRNKQRKSSQSPTVRKKSNKKVVGPNISLIEQIITDDRPLEDIISLDDYESEPSETVTKKSKSKKGQKSQKIKKTAKKAKATKPCANYSDLTLKECSIVLTREDLSKYLPVTTPVVKKPIVILKIVPKVSEKPAVVIPKELTEPEPQKEVIEVRSIEQTVVTDPADMLDMLDVSEDIIIGDNCEVKSGEKETGRDVSIGEDIILDNSQSSSDDVPIEAWPKEDECKMFDYSSDEMLKKDSVTVTGNADAVLAIECIDNNFVAACLDGNVYHFNGDGQLLNTLKGSNHAVTSLIIVKEKYGTTVYTGSLDSRIRYYDLETGLEKGPECNVLSPIQTMDRAWDTVFVGTRTGFVTQFECKNNMLIPRSTMKFSEQSILALRALKEGPRKVLLVAARSENVTIKDAQTGLLMRTLEGPRMTVYTLVFEEGKVYCGTSSHQIHVFDYASGSHCGTHEGGKGAVCLRATGGLLFAGCYDGCVYVYREGGARPFAQLRGPGLMLLSLAVIGTKIIAGYKDRSLYIWKIPLSILKEMVL